MASSAQAAVPRRSWAARFQRRQRLKGSLWMIPLACAVAGVVLAELTTAIEAQVDVPAGWTYSEATASSVLSAIVGAMVGLTGFVVAFGVLVVQMATQTLSPRFMRLWYRDGLQKAVLGTFVGTLTFALALLRRVGPDSVPDIGVTVSGVAVAASVVLFLAYLDRFIHRVRPVEVAWRVADAGARGVPAMRPSAPSTDVPRPPCRSDAVARGARRRRGGDPGDRHGRTVRDRDPARLPAGPPARGRRHRPARRASCCRPSGRALRPPSASAACS